LAGDSVIIRSRQIVIRLEAQLLKQLARPHDLIEVLFEYHNMVWTQGERTAQPPAAPYPKMSQTTKNTAKMTNKTQ
jgi:hypothetical protein